MFLAEVFAVVGGLLWAFGILGKRIGVQGSQNHDKDIRATITILVYTTTTLIAPTIDFISVGPQLVMDTMTDPEWVPRIPGIVACGVVSGIGGLLGTLAFAWSAGVNSALISMIENAIYTVSSAVFIALMFGETPSALQYVSGSIILIGILMAQSTSGSRPHLSHEGRRRAKQEEAAGCCAVSDNPSEEVVCCRGEISSQEDEESGAESNGGGGGASAESSSEADATDEAESGSGSGKVPLPLSSISVASINSTSTFAPEPFRRRAIVMAILAGACWGLGPVGKKYGVSGVKPEEDHVWTVCTYLLYIACTPIVPLFRLLFADRELRAKALSDSHFRWLLAGTVLCGILSGLGGLLSTLAFAHAPDTSALVSVIENGVYTVSGALLIIMVFKETPTKQQLGSGTFVILGLVTAGFA